MQHSFVIKLQTGYLTGTLFEPFTITAPWRSVLFCHGFTGNRIETRRLFVKFARLLNERGIAAFTFDYRGHGESSGDFEEFTLKDWISDGEAAFEYFMKKREIDREQIAILGFSMGGCVASHLAHHSAVDRILLWAPLANPAQLYQSRLMNLSDKQKSDLDAKGYYEMGGFMVKKDFLEGAKDIDPLKEIVKTSASAVKIIQAEDDQALILAENGLKYEEVLKAAGIDVSLIKVKEGGHAFATLEAEKILFEESMRFFW